MGTTNRNVIIALLAIGFGLGLVNVFLMPPFQDPDEIQHFLYCADIAYGDTRMEKVETEVLELLKEYKWFHFVGIGPGWENTAKISDISFVFHFDLERKSARKTLFHRLYGTILKLSGISEVLTAFYFLRMVSLVFYIALLLLAFFFFKAYFPGRWEYLLMGLVMVFQLATILNAVNYDVFMVFLGSLFFMIAYRYLEVREIKKIEPVYLLIFAGLAALTKLVGFMFLVYLLVLLCLKINPKAAWNSRMFRQVGLALVLFIAGFCWLNYLFPERFYNFYSLIFRSLRDFAATWTGGGEKVLTPAFFNSMADSFYFHSGWMGFKLSEIWYIILKVFLFVSMVGVFLALVNGKKQEEASESKNKRWYIYSLIVLLLQIAAIWLYYGSRPVSQGRYLFPLIIPIIILIYSGLDAIGKRFGFKRKYLAISFILFQAVMVIFALARIISVFYLELASPHPGL
jgi:hypothetical protein